MFNIEKIMQDLKIEDDYLRFLRIGEYIDKHKHEFPDDEGAYLKDVYDEILQKKFMDPQCSQIENIGLKMKSGILSREWTALGINKAQSMCSTAKNMGVSLTDWIYELYPDLLTYTLKIHVISEYERQLAKELFPSPEERRERKIGIMRPVSEEGATVGINLADLLNQYQNEMRELIDASNHENLSVMDNLRKEVNALHARIEALQSGQSVTNAPFTPKEISRVLDSSQYQYFLRNAYKLTMPVRYQQIAKGQYQVSIIVSEEGEERKALSFIGEAEAHEREILKQKKTHREGYDMVLDILCKTYSKESQIPCGISRTGALSTLADRLLEYASSQGMDWQEIDIGSIDLFAKRKKIYTIEQASEAFDIFLSHREGKLMEESIEDENECAVDSIMAYIIAYDAVSIILSRNLSLNAELKKVRENAIQGLSNCDYYPNRLEQARDIARSEMGQYGTTYEDQLDMDVQKYIRLTG